MSKTPPRRRRRRDGPRWTWIVAGTLSLLWLILATAWMTNDPQESEVPVVVDPPRKPRSMPTLESRPESAPSREVLGSFETRRPRDESGASKLGSRPSERATLRVRSSPSAEKP